MLQNLQKSSSDSNLTLLIVGGGAAGFFGAIAAAERFPQAQVILLEAGRQLLSKVKISGGGRCNVTHACFEPARLVQYYPRGGKALRGAFTRFQPKDTVAWFEQRGVKLKTEADGRMFPITDDSETILECLIQCARQAGVEIRTGVPVAAIEREDSATETTKSSQPFSQPFTVVLKSGEKLRGDRILLASGSSPQGHHLAHQLGHTIEPPVPSLFTFNLPDPQLRQLAGVSVTSAQVKLLLPDQKPLEQTGALLVTHWGFSGPAVLKLSAWGARSLHDHQYRGQLQVNWVAEQPPEAWRSLLQHMKEQEGKRAIATHTPHPAIPRRLWHYLLTRAGLTPETRWADLSKKGLQSLIQELTQGNYPFQGKGVFKEEFVTCGGVRLQEVDFKTLESRLCPGLYFSGEVLDIDGVTGGFNFQSAWTTGWLAGQSMGVVQEPTQLTATPRK